MLEDFRLKVFLAAAHSGSFTKAARSLGVSQPAVSQNISELEKETGVILFKRNRGSVTLTPAGISFMEYASGINRWYSAANAMFGPSGKLASGRTVKIAADPFCTESLLAPVISRMIAVDGGLSFTLVPEDSTDHDVLLRVLPGSGELSLESGSSLIGPVSAAAVASSEYSHCNDLRRLPSGVALAVWSPYSPLLPPDLASLVAFESPSPTSVVRMVKEYSQAVGLVPIAAAKESGLSFLPMQLQGLQFDLHFHPTEEFSGNPAYSFMRASLHSILEPSL